MMPLSRQQRIDRRRRLLALLITVPAILTALALSALDAWRIRRPDSPLFVTPAVDSLANAIARDDVQQGYRFIRAGQDPNGPIVARHPILTGGQAVEISPLLWAVATQAERSVRMLSSVGARIDPRAVCLAERLGRDDIAGALVRLGGRRPPQPCSSQQTGKPVVLEALAERE